jgi:spore maturation protein CgeD
MKITCILASYNRPNWVRQAIGSVSQQTHKDYQLVVVDDSTIFDISQAVLEFKLSEVDVIHFNVSPEERKKKNRLSININAGLARANGQLVCYLGDDDFYYPEWFANASEFFKTHPSIHAAFGKLRYTRSRNMEYPKTGEIRFFETPIQDPYCRLDHNQIVHRPLVPPIPWNEELHSVSAPDGIFMRAVGVRYPFHPISAFAAVKRIHDKNLQQSVPAYLAGKLEGPRE